MCWETFSFKVHSQQFNEGDVIRVTTPAAKRVMWPPVLCDSQQSKALHAGIIFACLCTHTPMQTV